MYKRQGKAPSYGDFDEESSAQIQEMHHNLSPNDLNRHRGLAKQPKVALLGFESGSAREGAYLHELPEGTEVLLSLEGEAREGFNTCLLQEGGFTDVFIAGTGEDAVTAYAAIETKLARSAAVNFVDGNADIPIRSRNAHYVTCLLYTSPSPRD